MRVRVLGGLAVDGLTERDLGSRKGRTLLKVLALARGAPVAVDALAEILWGPEQPAKPADQVGVLVSRLRGVLGAERLPRRDAGYALVSDWLDVDEVVALGAAAADALAEGRIGVARAAADAALELARGPLLPDEDGDWVGPERAAAAAAVARARAVAVEAAVAAGDHGGAVALAEAALAHDPYDEVVLRALMRAHLAAGRPASALAAYARVRERLAEDLGVPPTAETEAVHAGALAAADGDRVARAGPAHDGTLTPAGVVGREAPLAALDAALVDARAGGTPLLLVRGEAGMGKSTLVEAWTRAAAAGGAAVVLRGRCDELGRDLPLQPVTDALAEHLRSAGPERAAAILAADGDALAALLGPVAGPAATVVADAEAGQARLFAALAGAVVRSGDGRPVILVIEDLHLAGGSTVAWLAFARRRCPGVLLLLTSRPSVPVPAGATVIELGPLGVDDVAALAGAGRAEELHARSGGHPLLLAALLSALAAGDAGELPASVRDAVAARVDALGPDVAATLRVAAVLGVDCDLDVIAQVQGRPAVDVLAHLEAAAGAGLVIERGAGFAFRHDLVREALDAAAGTARRALVHRAAAGILAGRPRPDVLAVAVHAREGGDLPLASSSYVAAAEAAAGRYDLDAAEALLSTAIELDPTASALAARARVRMSRLDFDAAAGDASRAVAGGGGAPALEVAGWIAYYRRRYDEARALADEAVERAADPAVRASASALGARVRHGAGDLAGAVERLVAVGDAPSPVRGVADVWLAQARTHQGRPRDALDALSRPMVDPDGLAHPFAPLHLRFVRAHALGQLGRVAEALAVLDDLSAAVERSGALGARFVPVTENTRGWLLRWAGRGSEADEANRRAYERSGGPAGPSADAMAEAYYVSLLDLADGAVLGGDLAAVAGYVEQLGPVDTWTGTMAWHQRHRLQLLRARLALAGGDADRAAELASAVAADAASRGASRYEWLATAWWALADASVPVERAGAAVEGLSACAVLDGWPLIVALGRARRVDAWEAAAAAAVATVATAAGEGAEQVHRLATTVTALVQ